MALVAKENVVAKASIIMKDVATTKVVMEVVMEVVPCVVRVAVHARVELQKKCANSKPILTKNSSKL